MRSGTLVVVHGDDEGRRSRQRRFQEAVPAAVLGAAGARIGGPAGAALAQGLLPYGVDFFGKVLAEFGQDAQRRAGEMMMSAGEALGCEPGELADRAAGSERARLLTTTATFGAAQTTWPPRVRALGRVLADGLIAEDEATIDLTDMALAAMAEMERSHVSLLELLVCYVPLLEEDRWTSALYRPDPARRVSPDSQTVAPGRPGRSLRSGLNWLQPGGASSRHLCAMVWCLRGIGQRKRSADTPHPWSTISAGSLSGHCAVSQRFFRTALGYRTHRRTGPRHPSENSCLVITVRPEQRNRPCPSSESQRGMSRDTPAVVGQIGFESVMVRLRDTPLLSEPLLARDSVPPLVGR